MIYINIVKEKFIIKQIEFNQLKLINITFISKMIHFMTFVLDFAVFVGQYKNSKLQGVIDENFDFFE